MKLDPTKISIRASTQAHLEIEDVRDGLVILKDGGCVLVLATTAINFGLLSEKEQEATIYAYAGLLNSLTFPLQLVLRSQKKDVSGYLKLLDQAEAKEIQRKIKEQIKKYKQFVKETVAKNEVLDKKFYLVIPMSALEVGATSVLASTLRRRKGLPFSKEYILEKAKANLYPKRDHLLRQLNRLGLKGRQLNTRELIQLFFEVYNPEAGKQPFGQAIEYQTPIVQIGTKPKETKRKPELKMEAVVEKPITDTGKEKTFQEEANQLVKKSVNPR